MVGLEKVMFFIMFVVIFSYESVKEKEEIKIKEYENVII